MRRPVHARTAPRADRRIRPRPFADEDGKDIVAKIREMQADQDGKSDKDLSEKDIALALVRDPPNLP